MNMPGWSGTDLTTAETDRRAEEIERARAEEAQAILGALAAWGTRASRPKLHVKQRAPGGNKIRAGYTKNHGHGQSKRRRQMAKASKRRNRVI